MARREWVRRPPARLGVAILIAAAWLAASAGAAGSDKAPVGNRAGLVIVHGGGQTTTRCVEFSGSAISGLELLQRAGVDLNVEASNPIGVAVCRIDNEGCDFPGEPCFCRCQDASCTYWSYWQRAAGGAWASSNVGAAIREVHDGDIDGWVWGAGTTTSANPPPPASFDDICPPPTPTNTPEPPATDTPPPTATRQPPTETPQPVVVYASPQASAVAPAAVTASPATATATPAAAAGAPPQQAPSRAAGTPVITTPTAPASAAGLLAATKIPTAAVEAAVATAKPLKTGALASATVVPTPMRIAQRAATATASPTRPRPTTAPLLAASEVPPRTPPPGPPARPGPRALLLPLGVLLTGAGAAGVAVLAVKRRQPERPK